VSAGTVSRDPNDLVHGERDGSPVRDGAGSDRTAAMGGWLEHYHTACSHFALGGHPPISRACHVNNLPGHDS
jgi:hypothetical protein